jgi:hypothetical protein
VAANETPGPWWHKSGAFAAVLTTLLAVVGGIVSASSFVVGHLERNHEMALEKEKQMHDLRLAYLDRLEKPLLRKQVLQFMTMSHYDPELESWANNELVAVNKVVEVLQKDLDTAQTEERAATKRYEQIDLRRHEAANDAGGGKPAGHGGDGGGSAAKPAKGVTKQSGAKVEQDLLHARMDLDDKRSLIDTKRAALGMDPVYQRPMNQTAAPLLEQRAARSAAE